MPTDISIYIGSNASEPLLTYCQTNHFTKLLLVADDNTYAAAGAALADKLKAAGLEVKICRLKGQEITADAPNFVQVLLEAGPEAWTYLAVGSGSITDITRFVSYYTRSQFIAYPTAASVDGFTSAGAPSVIGGFKKTVMCHSPLAVFGDIEVLSAAPQKMIASGFGDMLGKYIALADWQLGQLLWHEVYNETISQRVRVAVDKCVERAAEIGQASPAGVQALMDGLIESGLCMLAANSSRPASGAEHQISHHLEMKLLWGHKPAILHGAKVGAASVLTAAYYDKLRRLSQAEVSRQLDRASQPGPEAYHQAIAQAYPGIESQVLAEQTTFMALSESAYQALKQKIVDHWAEIQAIAATVPSPEQMADWLRQVGGETDLTAFGFTSAEVQEAVENAHLLRNRFNVDKLWHLCGLEIV